MALRQENFRGLEYEAMRRDAFATSAGSLSDLRVLADAGIGSPVSDAAIRTQLDILRQGSGLVAGPNVMSNEALVSYMQANPGGENGLQKVGTRRQYSAP